MIRNYNEINDLIVQIAGGNKRAQEAFYNASYKELYRISLSILRNVHLAEDAVSMLFVQIEYLSEKCKNMAKPWGYIMRVQRNICLDIIKKNKKEVNFFNNKYDVTMHVNDDKKESSNSLTEFMLNNLTMEEYEIIQKHIYMEYSFREISEQSNVSLGRIQRIYKSALKKIEKYYL